jgi:hypothetical protein
MSRQLLVLQYSQINPPSVKTVRWFLRAFGGTGTKAKAHNGAYVNFRYQKFLMIFEDKD